MAEATWTDLARAAGQAQLVGLCSAPVGSGTMGVSAWGWRPGQGTQDRATVRPLCGGTPDRKSETFPSFASLSLLSEWSWESFLACLGLCFPHLKNEHHSLSCLFLRTTQKTLDRKGFYKL